MKLRRAFGFGTTNEFDPFLLFDDFRNERPADYLAGFPWHPHRGIETITYVLTGTVEHGDSLGNRGSLGAGDVQWMTAGSGILHQEMPKGDPQGRMTVFSCERTAVRAQDDEERYQEISRPPCRGVEGKARATRRLWRLWGQRGTVDGIAASRITRHLGNAGVQSFPVDTRRKAFASLRGSGIRDASAVGVLTERHGPIETVEREMKGNRSLVLFDAGDEVTGRPVPKGSAAARVGQTQGNPSPGTPTRTRCERTGGPGSRNGTCFVRLAARVSPANPSGTHRFGRLSNTRE